MEKQYFTAIDERGNVHIPHIEERGGNYFLTFYKETLEGVQKLRVLPMLAKAKAGSEGFFITPRNIEMSGDLLVKFVPREDTCYSYNLPIMSCYGIKTAEVCALVRIERNYKYSFAFQIKDGIYSLETVFDFTKNDPVYDDIRIEIVPMKADATLGDFAAAERQPPFYYLPRRRIYE